MEDTSGFHQRINHECPCWQKRADQVLKDVIDNGILEFVPYSFGGIFIQGTNRIAAAVLSCKVKRDGLSESAGAKRCQAPSYAVEVEDRNLNRGGPEVPVIAPIEPAFEPASPEPFPWNYHVGPGTLRRNRSVNPVSWSRGILLRCGFCRNRKSEHQQE